LQSDSLTKGPNVATSCDFDTEQLVSRLCGALAPADRAAFRIAAESALAQLPYVGPGIAFRVVREVFRQHFHPPPDDMRREGARHLRSSKLASAEPIGSDDPRTGGRDRHRLAAG
jgi:hypothetical protein